MTEKLIFSPFFVKVKKNYYLTEYDYLKHCLLLKHYNENGLLEKNIIENRHIYDFTVQDIENLYNKLLNEKTNSDSSVFFLNKNNENNEESTDKPDLKKEKEENSKKNIDNSSDVKNKKESLFRKYYISKIFKKKINNFNHLEVLSLLKPNIQTNINCSEYINTSVPITTSSKDHSGSHKLCIYIYEKVSEIVSGENIGELQIKEEDKKRYLKALILNIYYVLFNYFI